MTEYEKREIYTKIINEISKTVKSKLLEFEQNDKDDIINYINTIPYELRKDVQEDFFSYVFESIDELSPISKFNDPNTFDPNVIYTPEEVVSFMISKYGGKYKNFFKVQEKQHKIKCITYLPQFPKFLKSVEKDMKTLGWFIGTSEDITDRDGFTWRIYQFEPFNQKNESETIRQYSYLYHIAPLIWLESILKDGIIKRSSSNYNPQHFAYPERVYLVEGSHDETTMYKLAQTLYRNKRRDNALTPSKYAILKLNIDDIPADIPMYYDPNYKYGVFVEENIPADSIIDIKIYDCKKDKYIIYGKWDEIKSKIAALIKKFLK